MIKKFHQMFESTDQDQLRDILNIVYDEDVDTRLHYYDYADMDDMFGQVNPIRDEDLEIFGFHHGEISHITFRFDTEQEHRLICQVVERIKQLADITLQVRYNNSGVSSYTHNFGYQYVDSIDDMMDGLVRFEQDNDQWVRIGFLPFYSDRYIDYEVMVTKFEKDVYTIWAENPLDCSKNQDTRVISSINHENDMHLDVGDDGEHTHDIYKGKKITAIEYQLVEACSYPNKYTIRFA